MKRRREISWLLFAAVVLIFAAAGRTFAEVPDVFANGASTSTNAIGGSLSTRAYGGSENRSVASTNLFLGAPGVLALFGGGRASGSGSVADVAGKSFLNVYFGAAEAVYGGGHALDGGSASVGSAGISLLSPNAVIGEGGGYIIGGGAAEGFGSKARVLGNVDIEISGDSKIYTNGHLVLAGGGIAGASGPPSDKAAPDAAVMGSTNVVIRGGVFGDAKRLAGLVYFCGGGAGEWYGSAGVEGNTSVTVSGGTFFNAAIAGGGMVLPMRIARADVAGSATVTLKGAKALASASGIAELRGGGMNAGDKVSSAKVAGLKSLVLDSLGKGVISADIVDFDVIVLRGTNDLTFAKPLSSDVRRVRVEGTLPEGTVLLTLAEGSFIPAIEGTGAKWNGSKLTVVGSHDSSSADAVLPAKTIFDDEIFRAISKDAELLLPTALTDVETAAKLLAVSGISAKMLSLDKAGQVTLAKAAVVKDGGEFSDACPLPVFTATGGAAAGLIGCSFVLNGGLLLAGSPQDVRLLKVTGPSAGSFFTYGDVPARFARDGCFTIQTADGKVAARDAKIVPGDRYMLTLFVKDNGSFDLDKTAGQILDPTALVKQKEEPAPTGGSSGGCTSGLGVLSLLPLLFTGRFVYRRRQKNEKV